MAYLMDLDCLYSTVKNISGGTKRFGFLPPHGQELADDGTTTVFGNILDAVANGFDRATSRRSVLALEKALDTQQIEIVSTPSAILKSSNGESYMLTLTDFTLAVDDPCWESTA
tara:strand:+ start:24879 stop:25220 length:342 start_codon:yes stop_codon:yes gene_type:complete